MSTKHQRATALPAQVAPYGPDAPRINPSDVAGFWERQRQKNSPRYQKHTQQEAWLKTLFASMPERDPEFDAWNAQYLQQHRRKAHNRFRDELELLGLAPGATFAQIRAAYRKKARELHPDRGGSDEAMKRVNAAYHALTNEP